MFFFFNLPSPVISKGMENNGKQNPSLDTTDDIIELNTKNDELVIKLAEIQGILNTTLKEKALLQVDLENVRSEKSVLAFE